MFFLIITDRLFSISSLEQILGMCAQMKKRKRKKKKIFPVKTAITEMLTMEAIRADVTAVVLAVAEVVLKHKWVN